MNEFDDIVKKPRNIIKRVVQIPEKEWRHRLMDLAHRNFRHHRVDGEIISDAIMSIQNTKSIYPANIDDQIIMLATTPVDEWIVFDFILTRQKRDKISNELRNKIKNVDKDMNDSKVFGFFYKLLKIEEGVTMPLTILKNLYLAKLQHILTILSESDEFLSKINEEEKKMYHRKKRSDGGLSVKN